MAKHYIEGALSQNSEEGKFKYYKNAKDCAAALFQIANEGDVILFKGSRGMKVEECIESFLSNF